MARGRCGAFSTYRRESYLLPVYIVSILLPGYLQQGSRSAAGAVVIPYVPTCKILLTSFLIIFMSLITAFRFYVLQSSRSPWISGGIETYFAGVVVKNAYMLSPAM